MEVTFAQTSSAFGGSKCRRTNSEPRNAAAYAATSKLNSTNPQTTVISVIICLVNYGLFVHRRSPNQIQRLDRPASSSRCTPPPERAARDPWPPAVTAVPASSWRSRLQCALWRSIVALHIYYIINQSSGNATAYFRLRTGSVS